MICVRWHQLSKLVIILWQRRTYIKLMLILTDKPMTKNVCVGQLFRQWILTDKKWLDKNDCCLVCFQTVSAVFLILVREQWWGEQYAYVGYDTERRTSMQEWRDVSLPFNSCTWSRFLTCNAQVSDHMSFSHSVPHKVVCPVVLD